jgi:2-polyprenyl-3-methyl-5-hydroxy-6-metoxy-1,4-benzoquinol methylase
MPDSRSEHVRQRFERDARDFDAIYRLERSAWSRWFNKMFRKAVFERYDITFREAGDVTGKNVLDVGCGSGVYSVDFARRGAARVRGIDFSENMLAIARQEAAAHGVADRCEFTRANFLDIQLPRDYDVAIAMGVFDYLADPVTFLRKMAAVTRGHLIASFPGHSLLREPARKLRYALSGRGVVFFYSETDIRRIAAEAGVTIRKLIPITSSGTGFILVAEGPAAS